MTKFETEFSQEVWENTYKFSEDQTVEDTLRRVARAVAAAETTEEKKKEWEEKFFDALSDFKVIPGGRIMANAGAGWDGTTMINCFVGPLPKYDLDSIDGIYKVLVDQANTLKSEGGWGMDFSWIRPRGAFIGGIGVESPGAVRFMELFDKSSDIITSGSGKKSENAKAKKKIRKGAQMATLAVWHPDIVEFITAKQTQGRLTKFNMSVNCTDDFMHLVNYGGEDAEWSLVFPDTKHTAYKTDWNGNIKEWVSKGYPVTEFQTVKVRWLWNLIMESTYNRNEPGVMFLDRANTFNPLSYAETILSTNPCVTGDTQVITDKGIISIAEIDTMCRNGDSLRALTVDTTKTNRTEWEDIVFVGKTRENAELIELTLDTGEKLKLTPDHRVFTQNRGYVEAANLKITDDIVISKDLFN